MRSLTLLSVLLVLPLVLCHPAAASMLRSLSTADLVTRAERIVVGTVESQNAHWVDESHSAIVTDVRIRVTRGLKGAGDGQVITVRSLGGSVDGIGMRVFGEASYTPAEEVLLFAERRGEAYYSVGMAQGKLRVSTEGGQKTVRSDLSGAELLPSTSGGTSTAAPGPRLLTDMIREVSGIMQKAAKASQTPAKATPTAPAKATPTAPAKAVNL